MRISEFRVVAFAFAACLCGGPVWSFDLNDQPEGKAAPIEKFNSVTDAIKEGVRGLNAGDKPGAARAFQFAAGRGNMAAQFKLGRMYADGDGVPQDDFKAFQYFSAIANTNPDEARGTPRAGLVSKAFVQLGSYYAEGIVNSPVRRNPSKAREMFQYAASFFGDQDAQYNLGRMLLDGVGGERDPRQAARWFNLAAEKGHAYSQAVLGQILFNGQDGIPRQAPLGLSWMYLAKQGADPGKDTWVFELVRKAETVATDDERKLATAFTRQRVRQSATLPLASPQ